MVLCCTMSSFTAEPISKLINKPPRRVVDHRKSHKLRCPAHLETDIKEHQEQQEEWERKKSGTSGLSSLPTKFQEKVMKLYLSRDLLILKSFLRTSLWPNCKTLKTGGSLYRSPCRGPWWFHMKKKFVSASRKWCSKWCLVKTFANHKSQYSTWFQTFKPKHDV